MHRRSFILGMASLIAAPEVLAAPGIVVIKSERRQNETFDLTSHAGDIYIFGNDLVCCRFMFSQLNRVINFSMNYTEFCTFEGFLNAVERDENAVVSNVFASSSFPDIRDSEYLKRRKTPAFIGNQIEDLEVAKYCVAPTS